MAGIFRRAWFPPQKKRFAPRVSTASVDTQVGIGSVTVIGFAPTVVGGSSASASPGVGSVTVTGFAPTFDNGTGNIATPGAGAVAITGFAPTVTSQPPTMAPGRGAVTITGFAPSITGNASATLSPFAGRVVIRGFAPVVNGGQPQAGGAADALRRKWLDWKARQKRKPPKVEIKRVSTIPPGTLSFMDLLAYLDAERQALLNQPAMTPQEQALDDAEVERLLMEEA